MKNSDVKKLLEEKFKDDDIRVTGDGYHYVIDIISEAFIGLSKVKRTQKVYQALNEQIQSGELHALSINAYTLQEWGEKNNG